MAVEVLAVRETPITGEALEESPAIEQTPLVANEVPTVEDLGVGETPITKEVSEVEEIPSAGVSVVEETPIVKEVSEVEEALVGEVPIVEVLDVEDPPIGMYPRSLCNWCCGNTND